MTVSRKNRNNMNKNKNKNKNRNNRNKQTRNKRLRKNTRNKRLRKNTRNKRYSRKKRMRGGAKTLNSKTHNFDYPQQIAKRLNAYRGLPSVSHPSNSRYTRRPLLQNEFKPELNLLRQFEDETNPGELYKLRKQLQSYTNKYPRHPVMSPHPELKYGMNLNEANDKIRRPQGWEFTTHIPTMQKLITDAVRLMGNIPTQGSMGNNPKQGPKGNIPTQGPMGNIPTQGPKGNIPTQGPLELYAMTNEERKDIFNSTNGRGIIGDTPGLIQGNSLLEAARAARASRAAYPQ